MSDQFIASKSEEFSHNLEDKIREGNEKLRATISQTHTKEDVEKVTTRNDESALSSFNLYQHKRSDSDRNVHQYVHQRSNSNANNPSVGNNQILKQTWDGEKLAQFNGSAENFRRPKVEFGQKSIRNDKKLTEKSYEISNSIKTEKLLSSNENFFKEHINAYSPVKKNGSLEISDSNMKKSDSFNDYNNQRETNLSVRQRGNVNINIIDHHQSEPHNNSNANFGKSATFKSQSEQMNPEDQAPDSPSKLSQTNMKFFDTNLAKHTKLTGINTKRMSPLKTQKQENFNDSRLSNNSRKDYIISDSVNISQSPIKSPLLKSSQRYNDSTYRTDVFFSKYPEEVMPQSTNNLLVNNNNEYEIEGEEEKSLQFSSHRNQIENRKGSGEQGQYLTASYNISNDNVSDLVERLKIMENDDLISVVHKSKDEILIKLKKPPSRKVSENPSFSQNNFRQSATNQNNNSHATFNNEVHQTRVSAYSQSKLQRYSGNQVSKSTYSVDASQDKPFRVTNPEGCEAKVNTKRNNLSNYYEQAEMAFRNTNKKLIDKINKIEIEKKSLEIKLKKATKKNVNSISPPKEIRRKSETSTNRSSKNPLIAKSTQAELHKYEIQVLHETDEFPTQDSFRQVDVFGQFVDKILSRSLYLYKNKNCHTCSRLMSAGKTSKSCPKHNNLEI